MGTNTPKLRDFVPEWSNGEPVQNTSLDSNILSALVGELNHSRERMKVILGLLNDCSEERAEMLDLIRFWARNATMARRAHSMFLEVAQRERGYSYRAT